MNETWRQITRDVVMVGAEFTVTAHDPVTAPVALTVIVAGRVFDTDLLIVQCDNLELSGEQQPVECRTTVDVPPLRLDVLSGLPSVSLRARGLTEPLRVDLLVRLRVRDQAGDQTVLTCACRDVALSGQHPSADLECSFDSTENPPHPADPNR